MPILTQIETKPYLDSLIAAFADPASRKSLAMIIRIEDGFPRYFYGDKAKLTQVLKTLSGQAICRTSKGSVAIQLKKVDSSSHNKQYIQFSVEDAGCGLDIDIMEQILDTDIPVASWPKEFSQSDSAMSLRMASKLVEMLGGKLKVECGENAGINRFFFIIPVTVDTQCDVLRTDFLLQSSSAIPAFTREQEPSVSQNSGIRVLVVDDVPENRMMVEFLLKKMGHRTRLANNGQEAVDFCKSESFDAILMDIQMPVLDGLEATRRIRAEGLNAQSTIIAMTASGEKSDDFAALNAGCDDCLPKPVDSGKLQRKLARVAARVKQVQDAEQGRQIVSFLEGDSGYQKAVESFIETLPDRIAEIKAAYQKGDTKDLAFKIHALKGVGGFAGFPIFTEKAKGIERTIQSKELDKLQYQLDELVDLCLRTKHKNQAQL